MFTTATNETDGYKRYLRSVNIYGFRNNLNVLGLGEPWQGGNVKKYSGGGQKVNLLKEALKEYQDDEQRIVIFTDRYVLRKLCS